MVDKECNLRAGVYKVQTFGTTHISLQMERFIIPVVRNHISIGVCEMDIPSIAAIVAPFVAKGAEAFSKTAGDKIAGKAVEVFRAVADKLSGDTYAQQTLDRAKEMPESKVRLNMLSEVLAEKMEFDQDFAEKLSKLVSEAQDERAGNIFNFSGQTVHGNQTVIDTVGTVNIGDTQRDRKE